METNKFYKDLGGLKMKKFFIPLNLQFFGNGDGGDAGTQGAETGTQGVTDSSAQTNQSQQTNQQENQSQQAENQSQLSAEAIDKLIQSRVDKITAELGKKNSNLQKELDKLKKEKLSDEELRQLEIADKEKAMAEKEQALLERENRLFAIKTIKEIGLDDGSDTSLQIVDFVMSDTEENITEKVTAFKNLVDKLVSERVNQTFRENGRIPNGAGQGGTNKNENNIAERLGKVRAEQLKKSNDVLNYYLGG